MRNAHARVHVHVVVRPPQVSGKARALLRWLIECAEALRLEISPPEVTPAVRDQLCEHALEFRATGEQRPKNASEQYFQLVQKLRSSDAADRRFLHRILDVMRRKEADAASPPEMARKAGQLAASLAQSDSRLSRLTSVAARRPDVGT